MRLGPLAIIACLVGTEAWSASGGARTASANGPTRGGTITETVTGGQWPTLDPATDSQDAADSEYFNLIYSELFQAGPHGQLVPDLAAGYRYSDGGLELDIAIRPGVSFSDGTPFTAADVAASINRDLSSPMAQIDFLNFDVVRLPVASSGDTVVLSLKSRDEALISAFITSAPNWTVDQAALSRMGVTSYGQTPVGAGPFKVASNSVSTRLNLVRNPTYWQKGRPYLSGMDIVSVGEDNSALAAMQSGTAQVAMFFSSIPLVRQVQHQAVRRRRPAVDLLPVRLAQRDRAPVQQHPGPGGSDLRHQPQGACEQAVLEFLPGCGRTHRAWREILLRAASSRLPAL